MDSLFFFVALTVYIFGPVALVAMVGFVLTARLKLRPTWPDYLALFLYSIPVVLATVMGLLIHAGRVWNEPPTPFWTFVNGPGGPIAAVAIGILYFTIGPIIRRYGVRRVSEEAVGAVGQAAAFLMRAVRGYRELARAIALRLRTEMI